MVVYDSSVLIDYLDGTAASIEYIEANITEPATAPELVLFEVYQGEVYKSGPANFDAVDSSLAWLTILGTNSGVARAAAELQIELHRRGEPLAARDAFIAGVAFARDERLVVSDSDFEVEGLKKHINIDIL